jgi:hypothetical protein
MKLFAENLVELPNNTLSKFKKLKEGDDIQSGDHIHIFESIYAVVGKGSILLKKKVNDSSIILRKI